MMVMLSVAHVEMVLNYLSVVSLNCGKELLACGY